jgi:hypothetical protein
MASNLKDKSRASNIPPNSANVPEAVKETNGAYPFDLRVPPTTNSSETID